MVPTKTTTTKKRKEKKYWWKTLYRLASFTSRHENRFSIDRLSFRLVRCHYALIPSLECKYRKERKKKDSLKVVGVKMPSFFF